MIDFTLILETDQIQLRPLRKTDLPRLAELTGDASMWIYFTSDLSVPAVLEQWVEEAVQETALRKRLAFAIVEKKDGQLIGSTSFGNISSRDKRVEIGWTWIGKSYQGTGVNDQIKYLMLKYCFETIGFERAELKTDVLNIPARKALKRIRLIEEGILRSHTLMTHDRRRDTVFYSLLRSEWNNVKARNNWL